jgi:transcriptional regulator with XRE-family HTH domain
MMEEEKEFKPQHKLLDACMKITGVKTDKALADRLGSAGTVISRIRHKKLKVSPNLMLAIHEELGIPISEIRELIKES